MEKVQQYYQQIHNTLVEFTFRLEKKINTFLIHIS